MEKMKDKLTEKEICEIIGVEIGERFNVVWRGGDQEDGVFYLKTFTDSNGDNIEVRVIQEDSENSEIKDNILLLLLYDQLRVKRRFSQKTEDEIRKNKLTKTELQKILKLHEAWVKHKNNGMRANLRDANLWRADLRSADLRDANLRNAVGVDLVCPSQGAFTAWKKAKYDDEDEERNVLIKLKIPIAPEEAARY